MTNINLPRTNQTGPNEWADVESNDLAIQDVVNGELDNDNIKEGAEISGGKLADDSVPIGKMQTTILWGRVNKSGSKDGGSEGWTVERNSTGVYTVSFSPGLSTKATCVATPWEESQQNFVRIQWVSEVAVQVRSFDSGSVAQSVGFNFIVFG